MIFQQILNLEGSQTDTILILVFGAKLTHFGSTHLKSSISSIVCIDNDKKKLILGRGFYRYQQTNN